MLRIGLLGGMSWESSVLYERLINTGVRERLGGTASADLVIRSYNFAAIEELQAKQDWDSAAKLLVGDALMLQAAGAELILLCTNTMHKVADHIEAAIDVRFLHLADATARAVAAAGVSEVALLGTRYTMEEDFYSDRLRTRGVNVLIPDEPDRTVVHDIIYAELVQGKVLAESKERYLGVIRKLEQRGAKGVIAGCTEIELLIGAYDVEVPFFPTTAIHAAKAVEIALAE